MFERYEFLEIFDKEKIVDKESGIVEFLLFREDFEFSLYISPCEGTVILTLKYRDFKNPIYDITLKDIKTIEVVREKPDIVKLLFINKKEKLLLTMFIRPELSLRPNIR